ncbi:MAG: polyprenyl synthetase family protein, partial [Ferruginibacter sp.]
IGGAGLGNQQHLFGFGKNLGIAFQLQDDYLDAFGDPDKFGKQVGGDIMANKMTFLMIHAMETGEGVKEQLLQLKDNGDAQTKIAAVLQIYKDCKAGDWAKDVKEIYYRKALNHLEETAVLSARKKELLALAAHLLQREN